MIEFPEKLKALMQEREMTQDELAKQLGMSEGAVSTWLTGRSNPRLDTRVRLAGVLNVDPAELMPNAASRPSRQPDAPGVPDTVMLRLQGDGISLDMRITKATASSVLHLLLGVKEAQ